MAAYDKTEIENKANNVLKESGLYGRRPDIVRVARFFGFETREYRDLPFVMDGFLYVLKDKRKKIIGTNEDRSGEGKRFTIAQMLARYFLYHADIELEESVKYDEYAKGRNADPKETEVDYFANCLLAPKKEFASAYNTLKERGHDDIDIIHYLQDLFRLTKESVLYRIEDVKASVSRLQNENSTERASLGSIIKNFFE